VARLTRRRLLLAAGGALAAAAQAQGGDYPSRAVRIVVPFGAGGIADLTARTVAQALSLRLGQSVVVDNRPGAGGVTAGEAVARAEPDGHTLLLMSNATAVSAGLFKNLPFDARKDFAPVSMLGVFDLAIVVPQASPFKSLAELLAAARAQPGRLNLATVNVGSTQHLAAELFKSLAGIDAQVVPFNGTPAVVSALRAGEVDAAVEILGPVKPQIGAGALRALAVMGDKRAPGLPDTPTVGESGGPLKALHVSSWNALAAPAATPRERVLRLNREVQAALADPAVRQKLAQLNVEARASSPEALAAWLDAETRRWSEVIARAGIPRQ
jgi:tripartite-type tricarboxylate transporter receptor subunit TctC